MPLLVLAACSPPRPIHAPLDRALRSAESGDTNCGVGCPVGGGTQVIHRATYTLSNNPETRFAEWVAYKVTKSSPASGTKRRWMQDPDLPPSDTLAPEAYKGAAAALEVDRGHQAPLGSLAGNENPESLNYLSNITPQKAALNQGAWERLEDQERKLAGQPDIKAVHVVTGPLFEFDMGTLPAEPSVRLPSGYWKVIYVGVSPADGRYAAFYFDQSTPKGADFCRFQVTVASIEARTKPHLTMWPALPADIAAQVRHQTGTLAKDMGCPGT